MQDFGSLQFDEQRIQAVDETLEKIAARKIFVELVPIYIRYGKVGVALAEIFHLVDQEFVLLVDAAVFLAVFGGELHGDDGKCVLQFGEGVLCGGYLRFGKVRAV